MRLISKQHDYYDSVFRNYSSEDKHVFVREHSEIELKKGVESIHLDPVCHKDKHYEFCPGIIGFCGKIYPYIRVIQHKKLRIDAEYVTNYVYSVSDFEKVIHGYAEKELVYAYPKRASYGLSMYVNVENWLDNHKVVNYSSTYELDKSPELNDVFLKHKTAYFVIELDNRQINKLITLYPVLADYQFFRVFDIFATYQALENYLCNILVAPDDPYIAPIPDKIKAQSKGFDKFSFRKDKSKK